MADPFRRKQGQYLAFIHYYTKIHKRPPAEADMQRYFKVSPPSVHQMILGLEARGLIARTPGQPRSIRVLIPSDILPELE
jgi:Mn-dependent DtxR family transcriptional regulator